MKDLYLKYKFTDRGGSHVFDIHEVAPSFDYNYTSAVPIKVQPPVGEVRLEPDWEDAVTVEEPGEAANDKLETEAE